MRYEKMNVGLDYAAAGIEAPAERSQCPASQCTASQMTVYVPSVLTECGCGCPRPVVVICPGGGYGYCSAREGEPIAMQYLAANMAVVELRYAVSPARFPVALFELAWTVRWIRENARSLDIDPGRVFVNGFSAGGHLAASLAVYWNRDFLAKGLVCEASLLRPDGAILCYPVISGNREIRHEGSLENLYGPGFGPDKEQAFSLELQAGPHCPPAFIWHTAPDGAVPAANSLCFAQALLRHSIPVELHLYPTGGHGLSLGTPAVGIEETPDTASLRQWPSLAIAWIKGL